jgi:Na+-driven multidrug efflux pump
LGDTKTPLVWSLVFTGLNAILDPLFIFTLKFGASGAAAGTALAQYMALIPLLLALNRKCPIDIVGRISELNQTLREYVKAGSLVFLRTVGKVLAYSVCAREAALLGAIAAATYNITFQLGFATTQICESIAVAVQTLLARELSSVPDTTATTTSASRRHVNQRVYGIQHLIRHSILTGGAVAFFLSFTTYLQQDKVLNGLTSSTAIRTCAKGIFPAVLLTQGEFRRLLAVYQSICFFPYRNTTLHLTTSLTTSCT